MEDGDPSIVLSDEESDLFKFLQNSLSFNKQNEVTLRVAGGWVRDKIIGKSSSDIDIMVEGVSKIETFLDALNDYAASLGQVRKAYATIDANPEHGKHGSSCNVVLFGMSIDFVVVRGTTALDDAKCRDLTINAMFYNINKGMIEDCTGKGVYDLQHQILRTPIDPKLTLGYDPLRAVRIARFAAILGYSVAPELQSALSTKELRLDLGKKIKKDRIGQEMKKALTCARPSLFVKVLVLSGLFDVVFLGEFEEPQREERAKLALSMCEVVEKLYSEEKDPPPRSSMFLAACLWRIDVNDPVGRKGGSPLYETVLNKLRMSHQEGTEAVTMVKGSHKMLDMSKKGNYGRLELGLCLRYCGPLWTGALMLAIACDVCKDREPFERLRRSVYDMNLIGCWSMKAMIDGRKMAQILNISPGPIFTLLTQKMVEYQLENGDVSMADAEAFLKETFEKNKKK